MLADNEKRSYKPVFRSIKMLPKGKLFALRAWVKEGPEQKSLHVVHQY